MDKNLYEQFVRFEGVGARDQARAAISGFIDSFENDAERAAWVWAHLDGFPMNRASRLRHELFAGLVFPVLHDGFLRSDGKSCLWLGRLMQNLYSARALHARIGHLSPVDLFRRARDQLRHSGEADADLLNALLAEFRYISHEWPSAFLHERDPAAVARLRASVAEARSLPADENQQALLWLPPVVQEVFDPIGA